MQKLNILNAKKVKEIKKFLEDSYGVKPKLDLVFLENSKGKIFVLSKMFAKLNDKKLRINNLGMYFAKREKNGFRLSIEGTQMIKPKKNVLNLNKEQLKQWIAGEDLNIKTNLTGYIIIKHKKDLYGTGFVKNNVVLNFVPKDRRIAKLVNVLNSHKK